VLFNDAVSCQDWVLYVASVTDGHMSMEHWWTDTDRGKTDVHTFAAKPVSVPFHPKLHMDRPGTEPGPSL